MQSSVAIGDAEVPVLEDITDEEVEVTSASESKEATPKQSKLKYLGSKLILLLLYFFFFFLFPRPLLKKITSAGSANSAVLVIDSHFSPLPLFFFFNS